MYNYKEIINSNVLFQRFKRHKFVGNENEKYVIEAIEIRAIVSSNLNVGDLDTLNRKIFKYMDQRDEKEYETFTKYLINSKVIKPLNLDIKNIRETTLKDLEEIKKCH